jgi:predicted phosphodiesterase
LSDQPHGKILVISDVHGLIPEMNAFFQKMRDEQKQEISLVVHLGDFWKGRNYNGETRQRDAWEDLSYFDQIIYPIFFLRGNEDLDIPDEWWLSPNLWRMKDQEPFQLNKYKVLPVDYQFRGEIGDETPIHPEYSAEMGVDFVFSHRPPFGLLDHTLHMQTHRRLTNTGSPLVRFYVDRLKPPVIMFGHFHYSNFVEVDNQIVICIDKLVRRNANKEYKYSYALIDPFDDSIEVYWKNDLFFKYSIPQRKLVFVQRRDRRNLYSDSNI